MEKGPQFKVFHGDQGTLFNQQEHAAIQAQRVIPDEDRYPRGFTPERMREVKTALGYRPAIKARGYGSGTYGQILVPNQVDIPPHKVSAFSGHTGKDPERRPWMGRNEGAAKVAETIARSTVPVSPIEWGDKPPLIHLGGGRHQQSRPGVAGHYAKEGTLRREVFVEAHEHPAYDPDEPDAPLPRLSPWDQTNIREHQHQTLIHELGHHHSDINERNLYSTPGQRGNEEAYADDFKDLHYRQDPRDARRRKGRTDPRQFHAYDALGKTPRDPYGESDEDQQEFAEQYRAARKHAPANPLASSETRWAEEQRHENEETLFQVHPADTWKPRGQKRLVVSRQFDGYS